MMTRPGGPHFDPARIRPERSWRRHGNGRSGTGGAAIALIVLIVGVHAAVPALRRRGRAD
jgi:hypothetical protein